MDNIIKGDLKGNDPVKVMEVCAAHEKSLIFKHFSHEDALDFGLFMVAEAKANNFSLAIDISVANYQLFRYALPGTNINNDNWVARKRNTVYFAQKSSLLLGSTLKAAGKDIQKNWFMDPSQYAVVGGGFPINIEGTGFIGAIAVSGLPDIDDHMFIANSIEKYLKK